MGKIRNLIVSGLAAIVLSSCSPNLSTPENAVKSYLTEIKRGRDPLYATGRTEDLSGVAYFLGGYSKERAGRMSVEGFQTRHELEIKNCLPDIRKCIDNNRTGKLRNGTYLIVLSSKGCKMKFFTQKESDSKWRIYYTEGYFCN
ncbi:MAG: hypothetical protein PHD81_03765 [Candidatus Nanoarchaeia archaeon]|nr:hypothetical protein [Candidatus Nanoarchaeia archaeon]MDD5588199.1 hypothetical protein [Candidatus Nanoarchaeia archaeon]